MADSAGEGGVARDGWFVFVSSAGVAGGCRVSTAAVALSSKSSYNSPEDSGSPPAMAAADRKQTVSHSEIFRQKRCAGRWPVRAEVNKVFITPQLINIELFEFVAHLTKADAQLFGCGGFIPAIVL